MEMPEPVQDSREPEQKPDSPSRALDFTRLWICLAAISSAHTFQPLLVKSESQTKGRMGNPAKESCAEMS